jgi:outer membrane protein TolC
MKLVRIAMCWLLPGLMALPMYAQNHETYSGLATAQVLSNKLPGPQHLKDYVADGKLRLSLHDAILLTLENNSLVHVQESDIEADKFALLRTHAVFDPKFTAFLDINRSASQGFSELQGVVSDPNFVAKTLTQQGEVDYNQTFSPGTQILVGVNAIKSSSNNAFFFFNPYVNSALTLRVVQPLLRNRGRFVNLAPIMIARRTVQMSRAGFKVQVSNAIFQAVSQYWQVVEARGDVEVQRKSLEAADVTYQRDKRALELGALPPLDIYRSESEVASRRVQMIQAEYTAKQAEDALRFTIGAFQDPYFQALDLDLTEQPGSDNELRNIDAGTALQQALAQRPELEAARYALENDETSIRLARNKMKPDLSLGGLYISNGLGGNQFDIDTGALISRGGFGSSFEQLFNFSYPAYAARLTLDFPIKNRDAQADMGNALVSRHRDLYSSQQIREQVTLDITNAVHQLEQASLTLAAGKTALDLAQKTLAAEQRKYELGAQPIFFTLDAQAKLALAESDLLRARINYQIALAAVDHATGNILQPYDVQIADLAPQ